jgi:LacI family transcriptional regulator
MDHVFKKDDGLSYVVTEGMESTAATVTYLHKGGRRRIGYIKIGPKVTVIENRFKGYLKGLKNCGLPLESSLVFKPGPNISGETDHFEIGRMAGAYFAGLANPPDAVIAAIDTLAIGCMKELKKLHIRIPDDIAIIGFDNIALCELVEPALTTIAQPIAKLGAEAARIIIDKLSGIKSEDQVRFPGELIIRQSA